MRIAQTARPCIVHPAVPHQAVAVVLVGGGARRQVVLQAPRKTAAAPPRAFGHATAQQEGRMLEAAYQRPGRAADRSSRCSWRMEDGVIMLYFAVDSLLRERP